MIIVSNISLFLCSVFLESFSSLNSGSIARDCINLPHIYFINCKTEVIIVLTSYGLSKLMLVKVQNIVGTQKVMNACFLLLLLLPAPKTELMQIKQYLQQCLLPCCLLQFFFFFCAFVVSPLLNSFYWQPQICFLSLYLWMFLFQKTILQKQVVWGDPLCLT